MSDKVLGISKFRFNWFKINVICLKKSFFLSGFTQYLTSPQIYLNRHQHLSLLIFINHFWASLFLETPLSKSHLFTFVHLEKNFKSA